MIPNSILFKMRAGMTAGMLVFVVPAWTEDAEPPRVADANQKPATLTAEQLTELNKLIPLLVSADQKEREQSTAAIKAMGPPALITLARTRITTKIPELADALRVLIRAMGGDPCPLCGKG